MTLTLLTALAALVLLALFAYLTRPRVRRALTDEEIRAVWATNDKRER